MAILTSDHFIGDEDGFRRLLLSAEEVAQDGYLVTLGIEPTFPATGYGYIQQGDLIGVYNGQEAFQVLRFKEKPSEDQAQKMIADGDHAWNSGMFVWKADRIMEEFRRQMPDLYAGLQEIAATWGGPDQQETQRSGLVQIETIDYGSWKALVTWR
jgi:mannose-1-phosphate guanylyltransferase